MMGVLALEERGYRRAHGCCCVGELDFKPGERIWLALDVGGSASATALVWINERLQVGCWICYGADAIFGALDRIRELRDEYFVGRSRPLQAGAAWRLH